MSSRTPARDASPPRVHHATPSSLTPMAPASRRSAISVSSLPSAFLVMAPNGSSRGPPTDLARATTISVMARLSLMGFVFGIGQHVRKTSCRCRSKAGGDVLFVLLAGLAEGARADPRKPGASHSPRASDAHAFTAEPSAGIAPNPRDATFFNHYIQSVVELPRRIEDPRSTKDQHRLPHYETPRTLSIDFNRSAPFRAPDEQGRQCRFRFQADQTTWVRFSSAWREPSERRGRRRSAFRSRGFHRDDLAAQGREVLVPDRHGRRAAAKEV